MKDELENLIGTYVTFFCVNYIYYGLLDEVGEGYAKLKDAAIVYETGPFTEQSWKDIQKLSNSPSAPWWLSLSSIESFGFLK